MKTGLFLNTQTPNSDALSTVIADSAEQVAPAYDAGSDVVGGGQYYLSAPYSQPATLPFLARMAAEAGDMSVCAGIILLPLHNGEEDFTFPYADLAHDRLVLGAPDDIVREIERYKRELGVTYIPFCKQWPGMPHD